MAVTYISIGRKCVQVNFALFYLESESVALSSGSASPQTVAHQTPLSMEFARQEYWSGLPFPSPGDLSDLGIKPRSPSLQADSLLSEPLGFFLGLP